MDDTLLSSFSDHIPTIYRCIHSGFQTARGYASCSTGLLSSRTVSNIIRDHILDEVRKAFPETSLIQQNNGLVLLRLNNVVIRFKKLNSKLRAGNIPTEQATKFATQLELPFGKSVVHLNAGYVLDATKTAIAAVYIICPQTLSNNNWVLNLDDFIDNDLSIPVPPIVRLYESATEIAPPKVHVKSGAKKQRTRKKVENE